MNLARSRRRHRDPAPVVGEIADPLPPFFTPVLVGAAVGGLAGAAGAGALKTKYVAVDIAAIGLFSAVGASVGVQSTRRRIRALPTIQLVPAASGGQTGVTLVGRF